MEKCSVTLLRYQTHYFQLLDNKTGVKSHRRTLKEGLESYRDQNITCARLISLKTERKHLATIQKTLTTP